MTEHAKIVMRSIYFVAFHLPAGLYREYTPPYQRGKATVDFRVFKFGDLSSLKWHLCQKVELRFGSNAGKRTIRCTASLNLTV